MKNYTPLVIGWKDKKKQLTLLSQRKLALTARNTPFALKNHLAPKKFQKGPRPLVRPKTNHTCHQKSKSCLEKDPLRNVF